MMVQMQTCHDLSTYTLSSKRRGLSFSLYWVWVWRLKKIARYEPFTLSYIFFFSLLILNTLALRLTCPFMQKIWKGFGQNHSISPLIQTSSVYLNIRILLFEEVGCVTTELGVLDKRPIKTRKYYIDVTEYMYHKVYNWKI